MAERVGGYAGTTTGHGVLVDGADAPALGRPSLSARLRAQGRSPLVRAGMHLVASAGLTSALGLAYWSLAARRYSPAAVGATAGLLAAMELIAAIANLGLRTSLIRFVPSLGQRAGRVIAVSYLVSGALALSGAAAFVALHGRFFPELTLLDDAPGAAFFVVSTVLWVLFILQDSVLIGLRRSSWLPVENSLFALAKLALLVALASSMPQWGIYVSWAAPLLIVVVVVNVAVFTRLRHGVRDTGERLTLTDLVRFSAGDYAASTVWLITIDGLPLLVLALAGAQANAWYHLSWTVAYTLFLIPSAIGSALLAEAAHDAPRLEANTRKALLLSLALVAPAALLLAVGAPLLLSLFGAAYADDASSLLRLLSLSAIPYAVTILYVNLERARRRIAVVVRLYAVSCAALMALSAAMVPWLGVTATGVAWLVVQSVLAAWVLLVPLRELWLRVLPTRVLRSLGAPTTWRDRRRHWRSATALVARVAPQVRPDATSWSVLHATNDVVVARVSCADGPDAILKLPQTHPAELSRRREMASLAALRRHPATQAWAAAAPEVLDHGTLGEQAWSLESRIEGGTAAVALSSGAAPDRVLAGAVSLISPLHRATAQERLVDDALLCSWVDEPAAAVAACSPEAAAGLDDLVVTLRRVLIGRWVTVSWVHGDVSPANLVVRDGRVAGLVDWEAAGPDRLPELDLLGLVAALRCQSHTEEFGAVARALLERPWTEDEVAALAAGPNPHLPRQALVLLAWLHHVATNVAKSEAYPANRVWVLRNVLTVADSLAMASQMPADPITVAASADLQAADATTPPIQTTTGAPRAAAPRRDRLAPAGPTPRKATGQGRARARRFPTRVLAWSIPPLATLVWLAASAGVDPRTLGDIGLVSHVHPVGYVALAALMVSFAWALQRRPFSEGLVATHVGALVTVLFATPALVYPTVRYSWAWKHMGIVDYISRNGQVDPGIDVLPIYHNWPGFFAGSHLLQSWLGAENVITVARWAPYVVTLATVGAVCLLAATFSDDRRVVWLTAWLFVLGDWVGQEYFSPQALAYLLYLVGIALALRLARAKGSRPHLGAGADPEVTVLAVLLCVVAIATSHQITPAMLCVALVALTLTRRARLGGVGLVAIVVTVVWALWGATDFVAANVKMALEGFGSPMANAEGNLVDTTRLSEGQALVALAGRLVVVTVGLLAAVGLVRVARRDRGAAITLCVLGAAPLVILATNEFGGEILFRVYLFALPVAAYLGAHALLDPPRIRHGWARAVPIVAVSLVLVVGFLLAHFGKDGHYAFTRAEYEAAAWLDEHAPDDSLLVQGSSNYPVQFHNYEHFRYVPLDTEDLRARREIADDPIGVMRRWMSDDRDAAAYLLLTRSQEEEAAAMGTRPVGLLEDLETALSASDRFDVVYRNEDAVIFTLDGRNR